MVRLGPGPKEWPVGGVTHWHLYCNLTSLVLEFYRFSVLSLNSFQNSYFILVNFVGYFALFFRKDTKFPTKNCLESFIHFDVFYQLFTTSCFRILGQFFENSIRFLDELTNKLTKMLWHWSMNISEALHIVRNVREMGFTLRANCWKSNFLSLRWSGDCSKPRGLRYGRLSVSRFLLGTFRNTRFAERR